MSSDGKTLLMLRNILLCELHWFPADFCMQFMMLVVNYKAPHGIVASYLRDHLFSVVAACPLHFNMSNFGYH